MGTIENHYEPMRASGVMRLISGVTSYPASGAARTDSRKASFDTSFVVPTTSGNTAENQMKNIALLPFIYYI